MNMNLLDVRKAIVFADNNKMLKENCESFLSEAAKSIAEGKKNEVITIAREVAIDLQSRLASWKLEKNVRKADIDATVEAIYSFLISNGAENEAECAKKEAAIIKKSQTIKACEAVDNKELGFFWGHDYCTGIDYSLRRGATFVTSNPAKIDKYRLENADEWNAMLKEVKAENPNYTPDKIVSRMYFKVVAMIAERLYPIFEASDGKFGFACIQPNPNTNNDSNAIVEDILIWKEEFEKLYGDKKFNIVFKVPAVPAAQESVRVLKKHGLRLCMTLNFSVFQHDLFSDLIAGGEYGDFLVLMGGIVDDNVAKELIAQGVDEKLAVEYSHYAAAAILRASYANLEAKGLNPIIMNGSARGAWSILNSFGSDAARPIALTTMSDMITLFDTEERSLEGTVDKPIPEEILETLKKSEIFKQAYYIDGLTIDNLEQYQPLIAVNNSFVKAYADTLDSLK